MLEQNQTMLSNYFEKLAKSNLHLATWYAVPLRNNNSEPHWKANYLEVFLIQIRR